MKDSVIIRKVSCHKVHENVAPDVAMSVSLVVYDKELSYAEENIDDDDYNDNGDGDGDDDYNDNGDGDGDDDIDDAEDTKKFATPTSKQGTAFSEETDLDVYYGDLRTYVMANFPPITIDLTKLKTLTIDLTKLKDFDDSDTEDREE